MFFKTQSERTGSMADRDFRKHLTQKQHREAIAKYPELANQTWLGAIWAAMSGDSYRRRPPMTKRESIIEETVLFVMLMTLFVVGIYMLRGTW